MKLKDGTKNAKKKCGNSNNLLEKKGKHLSESRNVSNSTSVSTNPDDIRLGVSSGLAFDNSSGSIREVNSVWWFLDEYWSHRFILSASHYGNRKNRPLYQENAPRISIVLSASSRGYHSLCNEADATISEDQLIETVSDKRNFSCVSFSLAYHRSPPGYATPTFNWRAANCSKQQVAGLLLNNMLSTSRDHKGDGNA